MPSTYSPNLALELIGTGDQAGTWGNTTNTNLGTLIEQAISGYEVQSLTSGTTLALTIPNGASGVARNMYLEFTGNGSTVIVPSNKKLYFVYNNCTSGTITMKVAGQTGVTVDKGDKVILVSNGTDIVQAVSPAIATPASTTNNAVVLWDGTDGTAIKNSGVTVNSSGNITTSGDALINNVYIGRRTSQTGGGPDQNLVIGQSAAISLLTGGSQNLNTIVGNGAGNGLTGASSSGNFNTMFGASAGGNGGNVSFNTFVGYISGSNIAGGSNVAVGHAAMQGGGGNSATKNTAVGFQALYAVTTGQDNTAVGYQAGDSVSTGTGHTLVGYNAGSALTTANFSTAVGLEAMLTGNYANSLAFGFDAQVTGANYGRIGDTSVDVYAKSFNNTSDARDKADIQDTNLGLSFIMQLQPRMYRWDFRESYRSPKPAADAPKEEWDAWREANKLSNLTHDGTHKRSRFHQGLVAQEVKAVIDSMGVDFGGFRDTEVNGGDVQMGLEYIQFIAPLIKAIQELKAEFDEYKRTHP